MNLSRSVAPQIARFVAVIAGLANVACDEDRRYRDCDVCPAGVATSAIVVIPPEGQFSLASVENGQVSFVCAGEAAYDDDPCGVPVEPCTLVFEAFPPRAGAVALLRLQVRRGSGRWESELRSDSSYPGLSNAFSAEVVYERFPAGSDGGPEVFEEVLRIEFRPDHAGTFSVPLTFDYGGGEPAVLQLHGTARELSLDELPRPPD